MSGAAGELERGTRSFWSGGGVLATVHAARKLARSSIARAAEGLSRRARNRRIFDRLARMTDRELGDIGLSRGDVADALASTGGADASLLLVERRNERLASRHR